MNTPFIQILAHRGLWETPAQQNTLAACERALKAGFGIEIDVRDDGGRLAAAHDPGEAAAYPFEDICRLLAQHPHCCAAINIKSCGLQSLLKGTLEKYGITNYFTFDMAVPDLLRNVAEKIPSFTRQSEYETEPVLYERVQGVWLDRFEDDSVTVPLMLSHLEKEKKIAIVSPELHGRSPDFLWQKLKNALQLGEKSSRYAENLYLCTDHPEKARRFFNG